MAGLSVNVGANIAPLTQNLKLATAEVQQFNSVISAAAPTQPFTALNSAIGVTIHQFDELAASTAALNRIEASIDQAAAAATNAGARFDTLGGRLPLQEFNTFRASVDRLKTDVATGAAQIARLPTVLNNVPPALNNTTTAIQRIPGAANSATLALSNVGRVAQDLPFGFIGIQNNLNPLLESFQRLRAETGSNRLALRALGSSLVGAGGIGLALSLVSSAIVIFQNGIGGFNKKTKEASDNAKEFVDSLKSVAEITDTATGGVQGQIAQVQALASVIQNSNESYSNRNRALKELQQTNKSYFGDLKLEEGAMTLLTARVNEYTDALVQQAVIKGFTDEISRVSVELAKQQKELNRSKTQFDQLDRALRNTKQSETSLTGEDRISQKYIDAKNAAEEAGDAFRTQRDVVERLETNFVELRGAIDGAVKESLKFRDLNNPSASPAGKKGDEELKRLKDNLDGYKKQLEVTNKLREAGLLPLNRENDALELQLKILKTLDAIDAREVEIKAKPKLELDPALTELEIQKAFKEFGQRSVSKVEIPIQVIPKIKIDIAGATGSESIGAGAFDVVINNVVKTARAKGREAKEAIELALAESIKGITFTGKIDAIEGLGEAFGQALAANDFGTGLKKAAQTIMQVLGGVLQQIGRQVIAAALAIKALKSTLEKFAIANPGLAVIAGIGLVALGAALRNVKFDGPKFATGGIVTGPVIGQIGEMHRPEVILPLDRLPQMLQQFGGGSGNGVEVIPFINNEGLFLAVTRGGKKVGRKF